MDINSKWSIDYIQAKQRRIKKKFVVYTNMYIFSLCITQCERTKRTYIHIYMKWDLMCTREERSPLALHYFMLQLDLILFTHSVFRPFVSWFFMFLSFFFFFLFFHHHHHHRASTISTDFPSLASFYLPSARCVYGTIHMNFNFCGFCAQNIGTLYSVYIVQSIV